MADEHPRLDWHLENWARYHLYGWREECGVKTQSHWASGSTDFDELADNSERRCAVIMEALIGGEGKTQGVLTPVEVCVIHHYHLGTAVWRPNREPIEVIYERARGLLSDGLRRKGIS